MIQSDVIGRVWYGVVFFSGPVPSVQHEFGRTTSTTGSSAPDKPLSTAWQTALSATAMTANKKRPVRRGGKAPPDRPQRALFCLTLKNPIRKLCIDVVEWKYPFSYALVQRPCRLRPWYYIFVAQAIVSFMSSTTILDLKLS